jgi:RNA 2',3'-cyclic 3'-phosphodiesterase
LPSSRYFFAVWPPAATAAALEGWAKALQGRVTPAGKIHLTLAFLGAVAPEKALSAARRVRASAHALPVEKAQYWKHNKIVWAGPREIPSGLKALVESLHFELYRAEYILERRPIAAHITLLRNAAAPAVLPPLPRAEWPVREFVLARSTVSSKGSTYDIVERFPCD